MKIESSGNEMHVNMISTSVDSSAAISSVIKSRSNTIGDRAEISPESKALASTM